MLRQNRPWWIALLTSIGLVALSLIGSDRAFLTSAIHTQPYVQGNHLYAPNGTRLLIGGAAQYSWPFLGACACYLTTATGDYNNREIIFTRYNQLHVNATRVFLNASTYYSNPFNISGGQAGELQWIADLVTSAGNHGIYTLLTWNDSTQEGSSWPSQYQNTFQMYRDVVNTLGPTNPWVLYEPWNEPNNVTWTQWEGPTEATITEFRQLGYTAPLLIDTINWSWKFDPTEASKVMAYDAAADGGVAQVIFANHRYANGMSCFTCGQPVVIGSTATDADVWQTGVGQYAATYPLIGTEYGFYDYGASNPGPDPTWNSELLTYLASTGLAAGYNGYWDFLWDWNDQNTMTVTPTDYVTLNQHGNMANSNYYAVYQTMLLSPTPAPTATPTPTTTPTPTPTPIAASVQPATLLSASESVTYKASGQSNACRHGTVTGSGTFTTNGTGGQIVYEWIRTDNRGSVTVSEPPISIIAGDTTSHSVAIDTWIPNGSGTAQLLFLSPGAPHLAAQAFSCR